MGLKVTVGRAKGITVQINQVVPFAQVRLSATAVRPVAADPAFRSSISRPRLSALFEALRAIGTQGLPNHIIGLSGVFWLGDPRWPI